MGACDFVKQAEKISSLWLTESKPIYFSSFLSWQTKEDKGSNLGMVFLRHQFKSHGSGGKTEENGQ